MAFDQNASAPLTLYTATLDDKALADVIRRIPCHADILSFATMPLSADDSVSASYLKAFRFGAGGQWSVREVTVLSLGDDVNFAERTLVNGLCFFDALHMLAVREKMQKALGKMPVENPDFLKVVLPDSMTMYGVAATKSGQPLGIDGLPLPCAKGNILVDARYDGNALAVAQKSSAVALLPEHSVAAANPFFPVQVTGEKARDVAIVKQRARTVAVAGRVGKTMSRRVDMLESVLHTRKDNKFASDIWYVGGVGELLAGHAVFAGGGAAAAMAVAFPASLTGLFAFAAMPAIKIGGGLGLAALYAVSSPKVTLPVLFWAQSFAAWRLPDGPEKKLALQFNRHAQAAILFERAAGLVKAYHEDEKTRPRKLLKAIKLTRKGLCVAGTPDAQAQAVLDDLGHGKFPKSGTFLAQLDCMARDANKQLKALTL